MNMLKSCLKHVKMPFGVNTNTNTNEYNETHLNQENKKIKKNKNARKTSFPNPFKNNPTLESVNTYLGWVLGGIDFEFWVRLWEKMCFGLKEARRRQNESVWKNCYCLALKTAKPLIWWVSFLWSYLQNGHWSTFTVFTGSSYSQASRETLCLNFRVF